METATAAQPLKVLLVDDERIARKTLAQLVAREGHEVTALAGGEEALAALKTGEFDLVVTDLVLDSVSGLDLLIAAKARDPRTEVIIVTGHGSVEGALEATRKGAFHYLQKPIRTDEFRSIYRQASEKRVLTRRVLDLESRERVGETTLIGNSPKILNIRKLIRQVETSDANVLITGGSGTGKELVARAIHRSSRRHGRRFLAINCASLTDELLANELFGHEKGAYTGASEARAGLLESADGGTVFLDEVGDMSLAMQAKLLRVIQERELIRVGGSEPVRVDIRIIAATNKDLKSMYPVGIFREDLYYRLNVIPIQMPNLAERREDVPLLAAFFLRKSAERNRRRVAGFSEEALGLLMKYGYPGNVRELENIIERAVSLAPGDRIEASDLPPDLREFEAFTFQHDQEKLKTLAEVEDEYIQWVLKRVRHNKSEAARILGIDRVSLYRKLKRREFEE